MVCSVCGKRQSGFIQDLPLSDSELSIRICSNCNEIKNSLYNNARNGYEEYNLDKAKLESYFQIISDDKIKFVLKNILIETDSIFQNSLDDIRQKNKEIEKEITEENRRKDLINNHIISTGYNFEGYKIISYNGIISGEVAMGTGFISDITASFSDFFGVESNKYAAKIETAKQIAIEKLIKKSVSKGDNGIIGIDFDIITFTHNMIGISANGTSVKVEKVNN